MNKFYDGQFDILLATTIVESGLDIPTANTLVVHRADNFGLAQLYQIRGRVGRSKTRAYAYFTTKPRKPMTRHIKEVGYELYQDMLEEALAKMRAGEMEGGEEDGKWSPQINLGVPVLIPDNYVADLDVRLGLYRRLSSFGSKQELEGFHD